MKVIQLMAPGPFGGAERVVVAGTAQLHQQSVEVELWVIQEERNPELAKRLLQELPTHIPRKMFLVAGAVSLELISKIKNELKELPKDTVLHSHGFKAAVYGHLANPGFRHVHTHHGNTSHTFKVRIYEALELWIMRQLKEVHAVSPQMLQTLQSKGIRAQLVNNPLSINVPPSVELKTLPTLLFVGRLSPEKGLDVLLRALRELSSQPYRLIIVGDGVERARLEKMAPKEVEFVGFQRDITPYLSQAHALVMPSYREGLPLTLIEAVASGLPVIASRVGGIPELVTNQDNGLLIPAGDSSALANALKEFLSNMTSFRINAAQRAPEVREQYSLTAWGKRTVERYIDLIQS